MNTVQFQMMITGIFVLVFALGIAVGLLLAEIKK